MCLRRNEQQSCVNECPRHLNIAADLLTVIQETVELGDVCENGEDARFYGFEPSINQRLLPPTFPRYTKIKSRKEAYEYFAEMIERLKVVCKVSLVGTLHQALVIDSNKKKTN